MSNVAVYRVQDGKPAATPFLQEVRDTFEAIQRKAFELFERRGAVPGYELDDWLRAERDLFWVPQAEITEVTNEFRIEVAVPGFEAKDLEVTAFSGMIVVKANAEERSSKQEGRVYYSEFGTRSLFRRFEPPAAIDVNRVTATLEKGMLTIVAAKKGAQKAQSSAAAA